MQVFRFLVVLFFMFNFITAAQASSAAAGAPAPWREILRDQQSKHPVTPPVSSAFLSQAGLGTSCTDSGWAAIDPKASGDPAEGNILNVMKEMTSVAVVFGQGKDVQKELKALCASQKQNPNQRTVLWIPNPSGITSTGLKFLRRSPANLTCYVSVRGFFGRCYDLQNPSVKQGNARAELGFSDVEANEDVYSGGASAALSEAFRIVQENLKTFVGILEQMKDQFADAERRIDSLASWGNGAAFPADVTVSLEKSANAYLDVLNQIAAGFAQSPSFLDYFRQSAPTCAALPESKRFLEQTQRFFGDLSHANNWARGIFTVDVHVARMYQNIGQYLASGGSPNFGRISEQAGSTEQSLVLELNQLKMLQDTAASDFTKCLAQ